MFRLPFHTPSYDEYTDYQQYSVWSLGTLSTVSFHSSPAAGSVRTAHPPLSPLPWAPLIQRMRGTSYSVQFRFRATRVQKCEDVIVCMSLEPQLVRPLPEKCGTSTLVGVEPGTSFVRFTCMCNLIWFYFLFQLFLFLTVVWCIPRRSSSRAKRCWFGLLPNAFSPGLGYD